VRVAAARAEAGAPGCERPSKQGECAQACLHPSLLAAAGRHGPVPCDVPQDHGPAAAAAASNAVPARVTEVPM
jgi:hypothetical protein